MNSSAAGGATVGRATGRMVRRLARGAVLTAATGVATGAVLLAAEMVAARTREYARPDMRLAMRAAIGPSGRRPLRLVLLGDATALGVGVDNVADTVGGQLATLLAEGASGPRVDLWSVAVARSRSEDLPTQVARALVGQRPDIAVILVGANDVTHLTRQAHAVEHLRLAVRGLRSADVAVVVGTCPDIGALRAFAAPLRQLLGRYGRGLARRQVAAVRAEGGVAVDLGAQTGAVFRADAGTLCHDGFHPSADGYRVWAHALLPAVQDAIDID